MDLGFGVGLSLNVIDYIYFRGFILAKLAMTDTDAKIKAQGDKIRELKTAKSEKDVIDPEVKSKLKNICFYHSNIFRSFKLIMI